MIVTNQSIVNSYQPQQVVDLVQFQLEQDQLMQIDQAINIRPYICGKIQDKSYIDQTQPFDNEPDNIKSEVQNPINTDKYFYSASSLDEKSISKDSKQEVIGILNEDRSLKINSQTEECNNEISSQKAVNNNKETLFNESKLQNKDQYKNDWPLIKDQQTIKKYRSYKKDSDNPPTIKIIKYQEKELQDSKKAYNMFLPLITVFQHENIIEILDVYDFQSNDKRNLIISMQPVIYLDDLIIEKRNKKEKFTQKQICQIILTTLSALKSLYNQGLSHCNINSKNLTLIINKAKEEGKEDEYIVKLSDFGLCTNLVTKSIEEIANKNIYPHLPPELLEYENDQIDPQGVDVFCLGVILFQLVSLQPYKYFNKWIHADCNLQKQKQKSDLIRQINDQHIIPEDLWYSMIDEDFEYGRICIDDLYKSFQEADTWIAEINSISYE